MIRFVADENFNGKILRGVRLRVPEADILRVQDTTIYQAPDPLVLEWASREGRIVLSHDINTMPTHAYQRLKDGLPMLGLVIADQDLAVGQVIDDLVLMLLDSEAGEWENTVIFLPL